MFNYPEMLWSILWHKLWSFSTANTIFSLAVGLNYRILLMECCNYRYSFLKADILLRGKEECRDKIVFQGNE